MAEKDKLKVTGSYKVEVIRGGKVIQTVEGKNLITDEGLNKMLDVMFHGTTQIGTWYVGLVNNSGFSAFNAADVMNSHTGWTELTDYDEATRQEWTEGAASGKSITNSTAMTFTISASVTAKGIFVTSDNTKSGTSGTLWAGTAFASTISVIDGDQIKVTYTVSLS